MSEFEFLHHEKLDVKKMTFLFEGMGWVTSVIGNAFMDAFAEDELYELWCAFYESEFSNPTSR